MATTTNKNLRLLSETTIFGFEYIYYFNRSVCLGMQITSKQLRAYADFEPLSIDVNLLTMKFK